MFIGHQSNWHKIIKEFEEKRFPNSYLFYGVPGIGKKQVALSFIQFIFCPSQCGTCSHCQRIATFSHPDLMALDASEGSIKIDALRRINSQLLRAPLEAPMKIVLIDDAQEMTHQAANSLLKTLEEPPKDTLLILIAPNLFRLLPTIRSRCRKYYFSAPPIEESLHFLEKKLQLESKKIREILEGMEGSIGLTLKLLEENFLNSYNHFTRFLDQQNKPFQQGSELAKGLVDTKADLPLLIELTKRRLLKQQCRLENLDQLSQAQKDLSANVNKALVLENLFMDWNS